MGICIIFTSRQIPRIMGGVFEDRRMVWQVVMLWLLEHSKHVDTKTHFGKPKTNFNIFLNTKRPMNLKNVS